MDAVLPAWAGRPGRSAAEIWPEKPAKARQKDVDGRWTVKYSKAKARADGTKPIDIAIPVSGYKSHVSIDRMHGLIRRQLVTHAAQPDGARLRQRLLQRANTSRDVWADSACRSAENEAWLADNAMTSRIHRKRPRGRPMPERTRRANATKSALRSKVEHVFAHQKSARDDQDHWHCPCRGGHHDGEHGLQHDAMALAQRPDCAGPTASPLGSTSSAT
jgi:IS5 family transposase